MKDGKKPSILLSALDNYGGHPFDETFDVVFPTYGVHDVEAAVELSDRVALVIWGGADISPSIYGQAPNKYNGASERLSHRDAIEVMLFQKAVELSIPIIGICRGAQLACALSGGSLVQHVDHHAGGNHPIITNTGAKYSCPSLHHQMMYPWPREGRDGCDFVSLAWMEEPRSQRYLVEPDEEGNAKSIVLQGPEPEVIWIPSTKSLCIQSHPEFITDVKHPFVVYCLDLVREYVLK